MTSAEMITMVRDLTHTNSTQFPDSKILTFLNVVKDDFLSYLITGVRENWQWDTWTTASVDNQSEYLLPEAASDTVGNIKISGVSINYDGETFPDGSIKYKKARPVDLSDLDENWNYYVNYQSSNDIIYYIADKSILIAPAPGIGEGGDARIQLKGIKNIADYTDATTEANIKIPLYLHKTLVQGTLPYLYRAMGKLSDANFEQQVYEKERMDAVEKFSDRNQGPVFLSYPTDRYANNYTINLN